MNPPPKYCDACRVLAEHGLLSEAQDYVEKLGTEPASIEDQKRITEA